VQAPLSLEVSYAFNKVLTALEGVEGVLQEREMETMVHNLLEAIEEFGANRGRLWAAAKGHLQRLEQPL
jgi:hypothetical protein